MVVLNLSYYPLFDSYRKILDAVSDKAKGIQNELNVYQPSQYELKINVLRKQGNKNHIGNIIIEISSSKNRFTFIESNNGWLLRTELHYLNRWNETTLDNNSGKLLWYMMHSLIMKENDPELQ
jgi:hypothetical protein